MPITYNPDTDTIAVTGFTQESPCSFEDIYQADVSNGWGKVNKTADHSYTVNCFIKIGDGSTETWFADENKQVNFLAENYITGNGQNIFSLQSNSHVRFGKILDEATKATGSGCQFTIQNNIPYYLNFLRGYGRLELLSTSIILTDHHDAMGGNWSTSVTGNKIWNCIFEGYYHFAVTRNTDIFNLTVIDSSTFLRRPDATTTVNHCVGLGIGKAIWFQGMGGKVKDVYARKIGYYAFYVTYLDENDRDCYIINGDFDTWKSKWVNTVPERKVFRQYTLNLKVVDGTGNPIEGAKVILKDKNNDMVFSVLTDANGEIEEQTATYGYYQREGDGTYTHEQIFTSYSPHTLVITKKGYGPYEVTFELNRKIDWLIRLKHLPIIVDEEVIE